MSRGCLCRSQWTACRHSSCLLTTCSWMSSPTPPSWNWSSSETVQPLVSCTYKYKHRRLHFKPFLNSLTTNIYVSVSFWGFFFPTYMCLQLGLSQPLRGIVVLLFILLRVRWLFPEIVKWNLKPLFLCSCSSLYDIIYCNGDFKDFRISLLKFIVHWIHIW